MSVISKLAEFLAPIDYSQIPEDVREIARKSLLDGAGCGVAGIAPGPISRLQKFVFSTEEGEGKSTVLGVDRSASLLGATLLNGSQIDSLEFADVNKEVGGHPAAMVLPAALNMAEQLGSTGKNLLASVAIGYEAQRITIPLYPKTFHLGIHVSIIAGTFGAAAAAAKLLECDIKSFADALGICAVAPVSPFEPCATGGDVKDLYTGWASRAGVFSALLAHSSFSGTPSLAEGELGLYKSLGADRPWEDAIKGLGNEWIVRATCIKPYGSSRLTHSSIDAAVEFVQKYGIEPGEIKRITITTDKLPYQHNNFIPKEVMLSRFSIPYVVANVILKGRPVKSEDFSHQNFNDPAIMDMAAKVVMEHDQSLDKEYAEPPLGKGFRTAIMRVETLGGQVYETRVDYPLGDPLNPMSWEQVREKFLDLTTPVLGEANATKFADMVKNIEQLDNCQELIRLLKGRKISNG